MGGLNSLSGLNNVNLDFRPEITLNVQNNDNANKLMPEAADVVHEDVLPAKAEAKSVVQELDVLLLNAASKSVSADAAKNVRTINQSLTAKGILTSKEASKLERLADDATAKLRALNKFSGRDLAKALMVEKETGETVWSKGLFGLNSVAKAVKAAIEAQQTLSAELGKFNDRLAVNAQVSAALQDAFMELQFQCDRRASEIDSVMYRMYDLAQKDVVSGAAADPRTTALLDATFKELMPREAILMHGTAEAFEKLNANFAEQMRPLAEKLDAFAADGSRTLGREEILGLQRDMATMKNAIANVRANGMKTDNGSIIEVDKSLLDEMERILSDASERIAHARDVAVMGARRAFLEELKAALSPGNAPGGGKVMASNQYIGNPVLIEFRKARKDLVMLIRDFAVGTLPMEQFDSEFNACIKKFRVGLFDNLEGVLLSVGFDADAAKQTAKTVRGLDFVKAQFKELMQSTEALKNGGEDPALATGDVRRLLLGESSLSSLVEAKARGFKPGDVDPAADDSNVVESKTLGSGAAGTTYLLTTKSGEELVFKPELDSRIGLGDLMLSGGSAYLDAQKTANLNLATQDTAKAFGCEDVVVKYSVGSHDGQFGTFMEKAKGVPGSNFAQQGTSGGGGIPPAELHKIEDPAEQAKIRGSIAHAKALKAKRKVYGTDQWQNEKNIDAMTGLKINVAITKSNGSTIKVDNKIECVKDYNERICPSFFKREFFHNMFNKPKQSA